MAIGVYNRAGVRFSYPENWAVTEDRFSNSSRLVSLESPGGGFWTLQMFPEWISPWKATEEIVNALASDYTGLESEQATEQINDIELVGYDIHFVCLDFVVASRTRSFYADGRTYVFVFQAEDRDFAELLPVFQAMMTSVVRGLPRLQ